MTDADNGKRAAPYNKQDCLSRYQAELMSVRNRDDVTLRYVVTSWLRRYWLRTTRCP